MIGTKRLAVIRQEIEKALASTGADPIERLERDNTEVMEGLKRFLKSPAKQRRRKQRVGATESVRQGGT